MFYLWNKHKERVVLLFLVGLCLILIELPLNRQISVLRNFFLYLLQPSQKITTELIQNNTKLAKNILSLVRLREENLNLQEENYRLRSQIIKAQDIISENDRLRNLLSYKKEINTRVQLAKVINSDVYNNYTSVWIDKGSYAGIKNNTVVMGQQHGKIGLVGRIIEVLPKSSRVLLITDQESQVRVTDQRSRFEGLIQGGNSQNIHLSYFLGEADIQVGDVVVTNGKGGIFPPGLRVGVMSKTFLEEDKLFKGGLVVPEVNPSQLEEVLLLSGEAGQG